jgi:hypothetical protein
MEVTLSENTLLGRTYRGKEDDSNKTYTLSYLKNPDSGDIHVIYTVTVINPDENTQINEDESTLELHDTVPDMCRTLTNMGMNTWVYWRKLKNDKFVYEPILVSHEEYQQVIHSAVPTKFKNVWNQELTKE